MDNNNLPTEIGQILRQAREEQKMTQTQLADLIGTKQPSISLIESGRALPTLSFLRKIADAYKTKLIPPTFKFLLDKYGQQ